MDRDPSVVTMPRGPGENPGGHVPVRGAVYRFDRLDPAAYSGNRTEEEFRRYVARSHSDRADLGRVARPEVVGYLRLAIDPWEIYVSKIRRDLRVGAPGSMTEKVDRIALRFGVRKKMRSRLEELREDARVVGLPLGGPGTGHR